MAQLVKGCFASEETLQIEAIERMKKLGLSEDAVVAFRRDKKIMMSENGVLKKLDNEFVLKEIENHRKEFKDYFYHVIHSFSNLGETYECLMVSPYLEDWGYERDMLKQNIVYCYVINISCPTNSEAGSIGVINYRGSLVRTA